MKSSRSQGENISFPVTISVTADTVRLLSEMAEDMGISVDDVLSVLAEDAAIDLENSFTCLEKISIPDKCSKADLLRALKKT